MLILDFLRPPEKERPRVHPSRHPPRHNAHVGMVGGQIHPRRTFNLLRVPEHLRAHHHVHVLLFLSPGSSISEVSLVEEVPYCLTNGE